MITQILRLPIIIAVAAVTGCATTELPPGMASEDLRPGGVRWHTHYSGPDGIIAGPQNGPARFYRRTVGTYCPGGH